MPPIEIVEWGQIKDRFRDSLLLGNGASIAVHEGFNYESLYKEALKNKFIDEKAVAIFEAFGKDQHDFELVLRRLWYARQVNQALNLSGEAVSQVEVAYTTIRTALIKTVRATHVSYDNASQHFDPIARFLSQFRTVFSLNYDLILYWTAMYGLSAKQGKFRDCFHYNNVGKLTLNPNWSTYRDGDDVTLYFYPHGNLAIALDADDAEYKITGKSKNLLEAVLTNWEAGNVLPVFVCEGVSDQKLRSITSSSYLGQVYLNAFDQINESIVLYGWGMSPQEQHIVDQILARRPKAIAVSVLDKNMDSIQRARDLFGSHVEELVFFDAKSPGAWNNSDGSKQREDDELHADILRTMAAINVRGQA